MDRRKALRAACDADPFKEEVMLYLRNLAAKFHYLSDQVLKVHERLDRLEEVQMQGFRATGTAFRQTKEVVQAVVDETAATREELAEYGGVIQQSTYCDPLMRTAVV